MALCCVVFACSQLPLIGKIANNLSHMAKSHDLPRIEALVIGILAMGLKLFAIFPMRGTWLHAETTQHNAMSTCLARFSTFAKSTEDLHRVFGGFFECNGVRAGVISPSGARESTNFFSKIPPNITIGAP